MFYNSMRLALYISNYFYNCLNSSRSIVFFLSTERVGRSKTALFTRSANCKVDEVSCMAEMEGETQMIKRIFPGPKRESLKILVSFESLNGMWLLDCEVKA